MKPRSSASCRDDKTFFFSTFDAVCTNHTVQLCIKCEVYPRFTLKTIKAKENNPTNKQHFFGGTTIVRKTNRLIYTFVLYSLRQQLTIKGYTKT